MRQMTKPHLNKIVVSSGRNKKMTKEIQISGFFDTTMNKRKEQNISKQNNNNRTDAGGVAW